MSLKLLIAQFIRKQAIGCKISSCRRQLINNSRLHTKARNVYLNDLLGTAQIIRTFRKFLYPLTLSLILNKQPLSSLPITTETNYKKINHIKVHFPNVIKHCIKSYQHTQTLSSQTKLRTELHFINISRLPSSGLLC